MAREKGCTPAQLALARLLAQGDDIVPIPRTKKRTRLEENVGAFDVQITAEDRARIDATLPRGAAAGTRYAALQMQALNRWIRECLMAASQSSQVEGGGSAAQCCSASRRLARA
jgi:hypothetical protein